MTKQNFEALGNNWTLFIGTAAQCAIEEQFGKGFYAVVIDAVPNVDKAAVIENPEALIANFERIKISTLRDITWHGLRRAHPSVTRDDVSEIIDALGPVAFSDVLGRALSAAMGMEAGGSAQ